MKIQRGIVKYKDRNDIVCTYALTDDGKQYYFLDENDAKKFSNGNRIATTALVEAIDPMVKASNVGVIDQNGVIVVPFENRSIRFANDNLILVEKAVPTSQSVLDAIELRNDPTAATKLVSTPASIKDRLKAQMGVEGNYLFNDQFSEATVCDINGTNLVQGESYSFICMANDRLYLSKNTVDSPISEFSLTTYELSVSQPVETPTDAIDVSAAAVDPQVVEGALTADTVAVQDPAAPVDGTQTDVVPPTEEVPTDTPSADLPVDIPVDVPVATEGMPTDVPAVPTDIPVAEDGMQTDASVAPTDIPVAEEGMQTDTPVEPTNLPVDSTDAGATPSEDGADALEKEDIIHEVMDIPEDTPTDEAVDSEIPTDTVTTSEVEGADTSISDDLKAFADGLPSDEEEDKAPEVDIPPIVEEENTESTEEQSPEDAASEAPEETESPDAPVVPVDDSETSEETTDDFVAPLPDESAIDFSNPPEEDEVKEEVFSSAVTSTDEEDDEVDVVSPKSIDPETVLATVDRNNNGVIDSDEIMVPQKSSAPKPAESMLSDIFNTPSHDVPKDYGLSSTYSSGPSYTTPPTSYRSYDSVLTDTKLDPSYDTYGGYGSDNLMSDVARSMSELMRRNKEQRGIITQYQSKIDSLESQSRLLSEKFKDQSMRYEALSGKLRMLEETTSRLESRNQLLETKIHDQEKIIASQDREIKILRPQVEGKQDLARLLADARTLLSSDSYSGYDDGSSYYGGRVA